MYPVWSITRDRIPRPFNTIFESVSWIGVFVREERLACPCGLLPGCSKRAMSALGGLVTVQPPSTRFRQSSIFLNTHHRGALMLLVQSHPLRRGCRPWSTPADTVRKRRKSHIIGFTR
jgi:hypothetical protein